MIKAHWSGRLLLLLLLLCRVCVCYVVVFFVCVSSLFLSCSLCFSFVCRAVLCHVVWLFVSTTRLDSLQYTIFDVVRGGKTKWPHSLNNKCINFLFIIVTKPISLHFISKFSFHVFGFSFFFCRALSQISPKSIQFMEIGEWQQAWWQMTCRVMSRKRIISVSEKSLSLFGKLLSFRLSSSW